ncbi:MAG: permease [Deltaproteobacteria bacterium]|nr:permease [Deltaproteobacteria bacterium]
MSFLQDALLWSYKYLQHTFQMMYWVWIPGFLVTGLLAARYQARALAALLEAKERPGRAVAQAFVLGLLGSAQRQRAFRLAAVLLDRQVSPVAVGAFLVASHSSVLYLLGFIMIEVGMEFALGQLVAVLLTAALLQAGWGLAGLPATAGESHGATPRPPEAPQDLLTAGPGGTTWGQVLQTSAGWSSVLRYIRREFRGFGLPLLYGVVLGGVILAAGKAGWWPQLTQGTGLADDLVSALIAPFVSMLALAPPAGNIFVATSFWKTFTWEYPGMVSLLLTGLLIPQNWGSLRNLFGRGAAVRLALLLAIAAVLSALVVTAAFDVVSLRPAHVPWFRELVDRLMMWFPFTMDPFGPTPPMKGM